jgi:hypothetical protein
LPQLREFAGANNQTKQSRVGTRHTRYVTSIAPAAAAALK